MKRNNSYKLLKDNFLMGSIHFIIDHLKEDHKVQAMLVWIVWLTLAALFYAFKMDITFYKGMAFLLNVELYFLL
jgi:hypothetical protein